MPYAIKSEKYGTFVGIGMGLIFFTGTDEVEGDTVGQYIVPTCESETEAEDLIDRLVNETIGAEGEEGAFSYDDLSFVEVESGHYKDLEAAGLEVGNMADNELEHMPAMGCC